MTRRRIFAALVVLGLAIPGAGTGSGAISALAAAPQPEQCEPSLTVAAPPAGFNPFTATAAQLACYGFPTRPPGGRALEQWNRAMSHFKRFSGAAAEPQQTPTFGRALNGSWDGWVAEAADQSNNGFTNVKFYEMYQEWYVPSAANCPSNFDVAVWDGIGGATGNYIIQAGTESNGAVNSSACNNQHQYCFWWENYSSSGCQGNAPQLLPGVTVQPGNDVYIDVHYLGLVNGVPKTTFFYENYTTGVANSQTYQTNCVDQTSADFVLEEPHPDQTVKFGNVSFTGCFADFKSSQGDTLADLAGLWLTRASLYDPNTLRVFAEPGAVDSLGTGFTDSYV